MLTREMKDSGIEWIGCIPRNWKLNKLKNLFTFSKGRNAAMYTKETVYDKGKYPVYSGQTENEGILGYLDTFEYDKEKCLFTTTVGAKVMTLDVLSGKFSLSQNCLIMDRKHKKTNVRFFYYFLHALFEYERALIPSYMQPSLRIEDLKTYLILDISSKEQVEISDILDKNIAAINNIIFKTQQSIIELKKYKQSLITETVIRGLNKNIELKDSGIEWIGAVPKFWKIAKINRLFKIKKNIAHELGYNVLSVTQGGLKIKDISQNEGQMSTDYSKYQLVLKEQFVMNHMDLLTGWVDISKFDGVTSPDYRVFESKDVNLVYDRYFLYIFQICYLNKIFYGLGQGVSNLGRWRLQSDKFLNFFVPLPELEEQKSIVKFLDEKNVKINQLISEKELLIQEFESYKKTLIYEYVTGKREV
ncbi:restriction endonuclease subunit S [Carnobacterium divergens]|uniref:restriction endonuclease subunit S n=1 Tax=Carnobacterium divergens TaxID=2748 RepID=UPI0007F4D0B6|nr:restriction endonuclease subunit S [Carnobacterium divergens]SBO17653.1 putative restriction endonuclease, type I, HsdS [Carnobacterium divergens]